MAEGKKKKATRTVKRTRRRLGRRELIRTLAVGAGGAVLASSAMGGEDPEPDLNGQYVVWPTPNVEVPYGYPIVAFTRQTGEWIVDFGPSEPENNWQGGEWVVAPEEYEFDSGFWYIKNEFADGGIYYEGGDGNLYFHETDLEYVNAETTA